MNEPRPITADDVVAESNRNYDMGRRHAKEEMQPAIDALKRLYMSTARLRLRVINQCPSVQAFSDWRESTEAMQQAENAIWHGRLS